MSEQEVLEGNKLIAEFMGIKQNDFGHWINKDHLLGSQSKLFDFELKYHSSWDWLMPVVEKIEKDTVYDLTTNYDKRYEFIGWSAHWFTLNSCNEILGYIEDKRFETKINAAWHAVIEFIKLYNLCQKN